MGRPKGSKNKAKAKDTTSLTRTTPSSEVVITNKPKRTRKALGVYALVKDDKSVEIKTAIPSKRTLKALGVPTRKEVVENFYAPHTPLEKLAKAGLTLEDLKALLGQLPAETKPDAKAELRRQMMTAPISPAEIAKLRKEALANMAKVKDPQLVVQEAVDQVIKPNWPTTIPDGAGLRHFLVKAMRNGDSVSFDKEKWDLALKQAGIRGVLNTCKPEGSAEVDPQANQGGGSMNIWRVMIG